MVKKVNILVAFNEKMISVLKNYITEQLINFKKEFDEL